MRILAIIACLVAWTASGATPRPDPARALVIVVDRALPADKLAVVSAAVTDALATLPAGTQVAIISAGKTATVEATLQSPKQAKPLAAAVGRIRSAKTSDLPRGIRAATKLLATAGLTDRRLLVLTDGDVLLDIGPLLGGLRNAGITMSALGFQSMNRVTLGSLASAGGGTLHLVDDQAGIAKAIVFETTPIPEPAGTAVVLLIDRSGSMEGVRLEAAKEAARMTTEVLSPFDTIAIVAFDTEAQQVVVPQSASNKLRISTDISRLQAGGGTNIFPALKEAQAILKTEALANHVKHVILLSDGESTSDGVADLVREMREAKITVSAVGVQGADRNLLSVIAGAGAGRLYMVEDLAQLPKIFIREVEATRVKRR